MSRGNPPSLPSLKNPAWLTNLLTSGMIHPGAATHPQSAGCLNLSSTEDSQFVEALGGSTQSGKLIVLDADGVWPT